MQSNQPKTRPATPKPDGLYRFSVEIRDRPIRGLLVLVSGKIWGADEAGTQLDGTYTTNADSEVATLLIAITVPRFVISDFANPWADVHLTEIRVNIPLNATSGSQRIGGDGFWEPSLEYRLIRRLEVVDLIDNSELPLPS